MFDIVAVDAKRVRFIQCKLSKSVQAYSADIAQMRAAEVPPCASKELWVYERGTGWREFVMISKSKSGLTYPESKFGVTGNASI